MRFGRATTRTTNLSPTAHKIRVWIQEANRSGARLSVACREVEITLRTYRRWYRHGKITADKRPDAVRPTPANKLTEAEQAKIIEVCNLNKFASLPPSKIVPALLDNGEYYGSESTYYRVLKANGQLHHRGRSMSRKVPAYPTTYSATGPGQVFCWASPIYPAQYVGSFTTCTCSKTSSAGKL